MFKLVISCALLACALAAGPKVSSSSSGGQSVGISAQKFEMNPDGSYHYSYEAENGNSAQEQGQLKPNVGDEGAIEVQGSFQYTAPDGTPISVQYVANENGFQPQGQHIPQVPELIARALKYIEEHPYVEPGQHKSAGAKKGGRF